MDGSGGQLTISTALHEETLVVEVQETGSGIAPKDLPRLGERFLRRRTGGTGLGLAVVEGIVREHGGRVTIDSKESE